MELWITWLIFAAVLVVIEVMTQMVWTLCLAVGCLGALLASLFGLSVTWQIAIMAIMAVIGFIALLPLFKRWHDNSRSAHKHDATGMDALIGRQGRLATDITPGGTGRLRIDGDNWQATAPHCNTLIEAGTEVRVTGYDGNILHVTHI